jgi:hypothetical protein
MLKHHYLEGEIEKILALIYEQEPRKRHQDIRQRRFTGTGGWFLDQPEFENWRDGKTHGGNCFGSVLSCSGIPGAGKSVIW